MHQAKIKFIYAMSLKGIKCSYYYIRYIVYTCADTYINIEL